MDSRVALLRDVVEIVAIIAAGIWAFYVFVYENNFKPSHAPPSVNVTASMAKLSENQRLVSVRIRIEIRNSSTVGVRVIGYAATVYGQRVAPVSTRRAPTLAPTEEELRAFYRTSAPVPIYSSARVGKVVDPASSYDTELDPGDGSSEEDIFYVPERAFDLLTARVNVLYVRDGTTNLNVRLRAVPQIGPEFLFDKNDARINQFVVYPLDSLDLSARSI